MLSNCPFEKIFGVFTIMNQLAIFVTKKIIIQIIISIELSLVSLIYTWYNLLNLLYKSNSLLTSS
jgi:hypothetical protein